jgi:hypothetical protein
MLESNECAIGRAREHVMEIKRIEALEDEIRKDGAEEKSGPG